MVEAFLRLRENLHKTGKPREVEGVLDLYLIRPGGLLIASLLRPTTISPTITLAASTRAAWNSHALDRAPFGDRCRHRSPRVSARPPQPQTQVQNRLP